MTATQSTSRLRSMDLDESRYVSRLTSVWVVLLAVVVIVVVFYLIFITNSLASINGNLGVASNAVTGAGGHVKTLPDQIQTVNGSLTSIDSALKPISGQAGDIITALTSVNSNLMAVDGSLKDTSGSLTSTSSSLVNTSSVLQQVLGTAGNINSTLNSANLPAGNCAAACATNQLGVQNIFQRVAIANTGLSAARGDTSKVASGLVPGINSQLHGICTGSLVKLVSILAHPASC